jgi:hypothetical protein
LPLEEGRKGGLVVDTNGDSQYGFDTVDEAKEFAKSQHNPDRNPVITEIFAFREGRWDKIKES